MAGKTIPASRLRAMLAKQLQVLEALGDADVPASAHNGAMSSYQSTLAAARAAGVAPEGTGAQRPAQAAQAPGTGTPGSDGAGGTGHSQTQAPLAAEMQTRARRVAAERAAALEAEDRALAERVAQVRTERAQQAALAKHPEIAPLIDMLSFDGDQAAYMESARELAAAMGAESASEPAPVEAPPVLASNPPMAAPDPMDAREAAKARARATGEWSSYFRVAEAMARGETPPSID
jgi:hypothetical protein